jgi:hypothetical protein
MSEFGTPVGGEDVTYFSIGGGNIVLPAEADAEGAKLRTWKRPDKTEGSKWEYRERDVTGMITGLEFIEGKFGDNLSVEITNSECKKAKLQLGVDSDYFKSFASCLKSIHLEEEVVFNAYDFTAEDGKRRRGMSLKQDGQKVQSFYYDVEKKEAKNGMPSVDKKTAKTYEKDDWKIFYMSVKKFLKAEVKSVLLPDFGTPSTEVELKSEDVEDLFKEDNTMS